MRDDDMPLAQFAVAFNGASWTDPDSIALMVIQAMLGSWNKSAGGGKHMGLVSFSLIFCYGSVIETLLIFKLLTLHIGFIPIVAWIFEFDLI